MEIVRVKDRAYDHYEELLLKREQFRKEAPVLGIVKKSADAYRSILDGTPVVLSDRKSDVAKAYTSIAEQL